MINETEIWLPINGYEGLYEVSNLGKIKKLSTIKKNQYNSFIVKERIILPYNNKGYKSISLFKHGIEKRFLVHRIVAFQFIPNPENKPEVNHLFGIKTDNRASQLDWATKAENTMHAVTSGLAPQGEKSPRAKLTNEDIFSIRLKFNSVNYGSKVLAKEYNTGIRNIWSIVTRKTWKHI